MELWISIVGFILHFPCRAGAASINNIVKLEYAVSRWGKVSEEYGEGLPHEVARNHPHPGIAPVEPGEEVVYHKYYQWVVFVLFLQAAMFHLPRIIWKHSEGGLMKMLVGDLTNPIFLIQVIQ